MQLRSFFLILLLAVVSLFAHAQSSQTTNADPVLLRTMQQELDRAMTSLSKSDPAPYFISYSVDEESGHVIVASNGAIVADVGHHERSADISVRVGDRDLDNTHGENRLNGLSQTSVPLDDKPDAIARVLWLNTDRMYKKAAQIYV